jgi:hypothetical protein
MITCMNTDEQVLKLSAAMLVLFEFTEVLEDRYKSSRFQFEVAMQHLGDAVNGIVVDEMKDTGRLIPRPLFVRDASYQEETFYSDLGTLEAFVTGLIGEMPDQYQYSVRRASEALSEGTRAFLLADRVNLAPTTTAMNPWSVINGDQRDD